MQLQLIILANFLCTVSNYAYMYNLDYFKQDTSILSSIDQLILFYFFRKSCSSCHCETYHHTSIHNPYNGPSERMGVEEDTISSEIDFAGEKGYAWVPRGLTDPEVIFF